MTERQVIVTERVRQDIELIVDVIMQVTSANFAEQYGRRLESEIATLSYMAEVLPPSRMLIPKRYHKDAKTMSIGKRKLTAIFHIENEYIVVDKIIPTALLTY